MKLTELQMHEINEALQKSNSVLNQIKQKVLKGKSLRAMKVLEASVQHMELFRAMVN